MTLLPEAIDLKTLGAAFTRRDGRRAVVVSQPTSTLYRVTTGEGGDYCVDRYGRAVSHSRKHDLVERVV